MIYFRSILYLVFLVLTLIPYTIICFIFSFTSVKLRYKLMIKWPKLVLWGAFIICGIRWQVKGIENLPSDSAAIILSNHQSTWETLYFLAKIPRKICYIYKRELHFIPFFGWSLASLNMISINRSKNREAFLQILQKGRKCLEEGCWPVLFPEGTRVEYGKLAKFKMGGILLSIETNTPIIPIAHDSGKCWNNRNPFIKSPGLITVSIGPIIRPDNLSPEELNQKVRNWIQNELESIMKK